MNRIELYELAHAAGKSLASVNSGAALDTAIGNTAESAVIAPADYPVFKSYALAARAAYFAMSHQPLPSEIAAAQAAKKKNSVSARICERDFEMIAAPSTSLNVNLTRFNTVLARYASELKLAPATVVRAQANLAMKELADQTNPKKKATAEKSINRDLATVYRPMPSKSFSHVPSRGFVYLAAGPNFLESVAERNFHPNDTVEDMKRLFAKSKAARLNPGNAYQDMGTRALKTRAAKNRARREGRQHVINVNRVIVRRSVYLQFRAWLKTRIGIMAGSWCAAWDVMQNKGRKPAAFKFKHVQDGTHKGIYIDGLGIPGRASFTLINRATGVESLNSLRTVSGVLRHRAEAMKVDIKNILRGSYMRAGWGKIK